MTTWRTILAWEVEPDPDVDVMWALVQFYQYATESEEDIPGWLQVLEVFVDSDILPPRGDVAFLGALSDGFDYHWYSESRHYHENEENPGHVFRAMEVLNKFYDMGWVDLFSNPMYMV